MSIVDSVETYQIKQLAVWSLLQICVTNLNMSEICLKICVKFPAVWNPIEMTGSLLNNGKCHMLAHFLQNSVTSIGVHTFSWGTKNKQTWGTSTKLAQTH